MLSSKRLLLFLGLLILALGGWRVHDFIKQDGCLDGGGCWDERRGECEYADQRKCPE